MIDGIGMHSALPICPWFVQAPHCEEESSHGIGKPNSLAYLCISRLATELNSIGVTNKESTQGGVVLRCCASPLSGVCRRPVQGDHPSFALLCFLMQRRVSWMPVPSPAQLAKYSYRTCHQAVSVHQDLVVDACNAMHKLMYYTTDSGASA